MKNYFDFTGKKYLITGASSGIGRATAVCLAQQGAVLVLNGRNKERLQETKSLLDGQGHSLLVADLNAYQDMTELFNQMVSDGKKLDGFVHCAGIVKVLPIQALQKKYYDEITNINMYAFMELVRLFSKKKYHENNSSIVGISSVSAVMPEKGQAIYAAAKAGMNAIIHTYAKELASKHIRINSVMPRMVKTQMYYDLVGEITQEGVDAITGSQLLGIIEPDAIAQTVMFLLSDCSRAITGRAMYVDAGTL